MNSETKAPPYNKAVIAGAVVLIPALVFWILLLLYRISGIGRSLMGTLAQLEVTQAGSAILVTIVIGCPFFALPLTVIGRWLARVNGQRGIRLGSAVLAISIGFLVLGLAVPFILNRT